MSDMNWSPAVKQKMFDTLPDEAEAWAAVVDGDEEISKPRQHCILTFELTGEMITSIVDRELHFKPLQTGRARIKFFKQPTERDFWLTIPLSGPIESLESEVMLTRVPFGGGG